MTLLAHAGHWIAQLLYLAPVVAMVAAIVWSRLRARGRSHEEPERLRHDALGD
jgi:cytochrome c-type biogenesis protein CcmH/NrfF